jgi:hypothetical protein
VLGTLACAAALAVGIPVAGASPAPSTVRSGHNACVTHGKTRSALGNWMQYDWNDSKCPAGTYAASLAPVPVTTPFNFATATSPGKSVLTGGKFYDGSTDPATVRATEVGTVHLAAGTYQVSLNAKAAPPSGGTGSASVFPQFFLYNQAANANFTGDLFNVGSGALESGSNSNVDSYFSGTGVIVVPAGGQTLRIYAFGYDSDRGESTYTLENLTVTTVPLG